MKKCGSIKITILMPTFNSESTVSAALASIKHQSFKDYEVIIIDNLSTDKTLSLIESSNIENVKLISERDTGIYEALNKGVNIASGQYITILHSTDYYGSELCLGNAVHALESNNADFCFGVVKMFDDQTKNIVREFYYPNFERSWIKYGYMPPHPTIVLRRSFIEKNSLNYDEKFEICGDFELIIRLFNIKNVKKTFCQEFCILMDNRGKSSNKIQNFLKMNKEVYWAFSQNGTPFLFFTALLRYVTKINELRIFRK